MSSDQSIFRLGTSLGLCVPYMHCTVRVLQLYAPFLVSGLAESRRTVTLTSLAIWLPGQRQVVPLSLYRSADGIPFPAWIQDASNAVCSSGRQSLIVVCHLVTSPSDL